MTLRSIHDLTTEEAYRLAAEHFGHDLPPPDAIENEDGAGITSCKSCWNTRRRNCLWLA